MDNNLSTIPSISETISSLSSLSPLLDNRQLIYLPDRNHTQTSLPSSGPQGYVLSAIKLPWPIHKVRETVNDFSKWPEIIEFIDHAEVVQRRGKQFTVEFELGLEMGIISPSFQYKLQYHETDDNDLVWSMKTGDLKAHRGRWEFIELNNEETVLSYTLYTDFTGASIMVNTVLWAQPDLKVAMPITKAGVFLNSFWSYFNRSENQNKSKENPEIPKVSSMDSDALDLFSNLARDGTTMLIHPSQKIESKSFDTVDLVFTTGATIFDVPTDFALEKLTRFENYTEFINQVSEVDVTKTDDKFQSEWVFKLGFGILSMTIRFLIDYEWVEENILKLTLISGNFESIYGHLEWIQLEDDKTMYTVSTASVIGEDAPSLVKLANLVPRRQIFMGTTLSTVVLQGSSSWIHSVFQEDSDSNNLPN